MLNKEVEIKISITKEERSRIDDYLRSCESFRYLGFSEKSDFVYDLNGKSFRYRAENTILPDGNTKRTNYFTTKMKWLENGVETNDENELEFLVRLPEGRKSDTEEVNNFLFAAGFVSKFKKAKSYHKFTDWKCHTTFEFGEVKVTGETGEWKNLGNWLEIENISGLPADEALENIKQWLEELNINFDRRDDRPWKTIEEHK